MFYYGLHSAVHSKTLIPFSYNLIYLKNKQIVLLLITQPSHILFSHIFFITVLV
jgi:hypothetical protein